MGLFGTKPGSGRRWGRYTPALPAALALLIGVAAAGPALAQDATPAASPAAATSATPDPAQRPVAEAVAYLLAEQGENGGFLGFSGEPDPGTTADAISALKAAGYRGQTTAPAIDAAIVYLEGEAAGYAAAGPGQAAKLALAAVAAGRDPASFAGIDLLAAATSPAAAPADAAAASPVALPAGVYGTGLYDHALVLLALAAAERPVPSDAVDALRATQQGDGSWAFDGATTPGTGDSNTTALVVQALVAAGGGDDPMVAAALDYLRSVQTVTGQFAFQAVDAEPLVADANSTALAVQAIVAARQDPTSADEWNNAAKGLAAFQNVSGAFRYQDTDPADNLLATLQALPAIAGVPLPVATACPAAATGTPETVAAAGATPIIALPAPARGETPCVQVEAAA